MSTSMPKDELASIEPSQLEAVAGGKSSANSEVTAALTAIQGSLSDLGNKKSESDPMQMILMMMMMGGMGGGGGGGAVAAPAAATPPVINIQTAVSGGGGGGCFVPRRGKKGW